MIQAHCCVLKESAIGDTVHVHIVVVYKGGVQKILDCPTSLNCGLL